MSYGNLPIPTFSSPCLENQTQPFCVLGSGYRVHPAADFVNVIMVNRWYTHSGITNESPHSRNNSLPNAWHSNQRIGHAAWGAKAGPKGFQAQPLLDEYARSSTLAPSPVLLSMIWKPAQLGLLKHSISETQYFHTKVTWTILTCHWTSL